MEEKPSQSMQDRLAEAQMQKLQLEISSLKWQNSWLGRVSLYTALAAVLTAGFGVAKYFEDRHQTREAQVKERDIRLKELAERADNRYRDDLEQLLRYVTDETQTIPRVVFLLHDLHDVVESNYQGQELEDRRFRAGISIAMLVSSDQFDLLKPRNVEFDEIALAGCGYYEDFLKDPTGLSMRIRGYNLEILSKYAFALRSLNQESNIYKSITADDYGGMAIDNSSGTDYHKANLYTDLVRRYKTHVRLIKESLVEHPQEADKLNADLKGAFCNFYGSTENGSLAKYVFEIDDNELQKRIADCGDNR